MMVVLSRNPVFSVLFLILSFFNISALLFLLELEFLPIVFLVVYVGAVAVLFLFVLMMLNIKLAELRENTTHYLPIACFLFFIFCLELILIFYFEFTPLRSQKIHIEFLDELCLILNSSFEFYSWFCKQSNVSFIGDLLFTNYSYVFLVSAFILLLAMVGTIVLTLQKKFTSKSQLIYQQVLRRSNESIKIYNLKKL
jgi:NADH-quinone oxidoreductase subunit J